MRRRACLAVLLGVLITMGQPASVAQEYSPRAMQAWNPNGSVWAIAVTEDRVYLGGEFTSLQNPTTGETVTRTRLAALDRSTGAPVAEWTPSADAAVYALEAAPNGRIYVGGDFSQVNGSPAARLAALNGAGDRVSGWTASADQRVLDIEQAGRALFVAGQFGVVDGLSRPRVARLDAASGDLVGGFNAQVSATGHVETLEVYKGVVYLGGTFLSLGDLTRRFTGAVDAGTGEAKPWRPVARCGTCRVYELDVVGDRVFGAVGGYGGRAVAWSRKNGAVLWEHLTDGDVHSVDAYDGVAHFGGHFWETFGGEPRAQLGAVEIRTGKVLDLRILTRAPAYPGIWELKAGDDALRAGGWSVLRDQPVQHYFALPAVNPVTAVTVSLSGCDQGCRVRLAQAREDRARVWSTKWLRATGGRRTFEVPMSRTRGMTVQIRAPWDGRLGGNTEVVVRYADQTPGSTVDATKASRKARATSCFAGTSLATHRFGVQVKRTRVWGPDGPTTGTRAWTRVTQRYWQPMRTSPKGVLRTRGVTPCIAP